MAQKYVLRKIGKHLCNVVLVAGTSAQLLAPLVHADEAPASPATEVAEGAPVASPEVATPTTATPTSVTAETEGNTTVEPERVVETTLAPPTVGPNGEGTETNPPAEKPVAEQQHKFSYNLNIEYEYQGSVIKVDATRTVDVPDRVSADKGLDAESSEIQAKTGQMMIKDGIQYRLASVKSITKEAFEEGPTRTHVNMKIRFELEVIDQTTGETPTSETPTSETPTSETPTSETPTSETQQPRPVETFVTMTMIDNKGAFVQPKVRWTSPLDVETTYPVGSQILVDETYYEVLMVHAESIVTPRPDMDRDLREIAYTVEVKPVRTVRFGYELNTIYRYKDKQVKFEKVINVYDTRQTRNGVLTMAIYNFRNNTTDVVAQNVHYKVKSIREEAGDKEIRHGESIQVVNLIVELDLANPVILNQDEAPTPDLQEKPEAEAPISETGGSEELPAPDENVPTSETPTSETPTSETPTSETPTSEDVVPNKDTENPVVPSDAKPEPALVTTETPTIVSETPKDATGPGTSQDEPSADVTGKDQPVIENNANHLVGGGQTTEKPKEESSDKERLPETGTESVIGTVIAGIGSILGSIGLVARKKQ
jgi:LPXTG-motif cell wall-anchored protein